MDVDRIDLNLLRVFEAILQELNITSAGARLGLTQPAMSNALKRLRLHFNDPLFVRTTTGMRPTPLAVRIASPVTRALAMIRDAIKHDEGFNPTTSRRKFVLITIDLGEINLLPRLIPPLREHAPNVVVVTEQRHYDRYREALESGDADLAWGRLPRGQADFIQQPLFEDPWVCVVRKNHPKIGSSLSMLQFLDAEQVVVSSRNMPASMVPAALGRRAVKRKIVLEVSHYLCVPSIVEASNLICVVPRSLSVNLLRRYQLKVLPIPFRISAPLIRQFWHKRMHDDPGHKWFRATIASLMRDANALRHSSYSPSLSFSPVAEERSSGAP